jgi:hypothetical protein
MEYMENPSSGSADEEDAGINQGDRIQQNVESLRMLTKENRSTIRRYTGEDADLNSTSFCILSSRFFPELTNNTQSTSAKSKPRTRPTHRRRRPIPPFTLISKEDFVTWVDKESEKFFIKYFNGKRYDGAVRLEGRVTRDNIQHLNRQLERDPNNPFLMKKMYNIRFVLMKYRYYLETLKVTEVPRREYKIWKTEYGYEESLNILNKERRCKQIFEMDLGDTFQHLTNDQQHEYTREKRSFDHANGPTFWTNFPEPTRQT